MDCFNIQLFAYLGFFNIVFDSGLYVSTVSIDIISHFKKLNGNVPKTMIPLISLTYLQADCAIPSTASKPKNFEYVGIKNQ